MNFWTTESKVAAGVVVGMFTAILSRDFTPTCEPTSMLSMGAYAAMSPLSADFRRVSIKVLTLGECGRPPRTARTAYEMITNKT